MLLLMPPLLQYLTRSVPAILPNRAISATHRPFGIDPNPSSNSHAAAETTSESTSSKKPLAIPEAPHNSTTQLEMSSGGASVRLNHLGSMVVKEDGTLSRISNWDKMADNEKETTLRIIWKWNQTRLEQLRAKEGAQ